MEEEKDNFMAVPHHFLPYDNNCSGLNKLSSLSSLRTFVDPAGVSPGENHAYPKAGYLNNMSYSNL